MQEIIAFVTGFGIMPGIITGGLGLVLGWFIWGRGTGDLASVDEKKRDEDGQSLQMRITDLEVQILDRDRDISDLKSQLASSVAADGTSSTGDDEAYALEWRNRYLAARVKYLESRLSDIPAGEQKPTAKAAPAQKKAAAKPTAKAAPTQKKAAAKTTAKAAPAQKKAAAKTTAKAAPAQKKAAAKTTAKAAPAQKKTTAKPTDKKPKAALDKYYANVKKFDDQAQRDVVAAIVKHCGASLHSRDSSLVACTDEAALKDVAKNFVTKTLGVTTGQIDLVKAVCQDMKSQRMKNRVTFYYLTAKKAGKLDVFSES